MRTLSAITFWSVIAGCGSDAAHVPPLDASPSGATPSHAEGGEAPEAAAPVVADDARIEVGEPALCPDPTSRSEAAFYAVSLGTASITPTAGPVGAGVAVADFTGDGRLDLL